MANIFRPEVVAFSFSNASAMAAKGVRTILVQGNRCRRAATNPPGDEPWAAPLAWTRTLGLANIEEVLIKRGATCAVHETGERVCQDFGCDMLPFL
jgi:hypothetical protein